MSGTRSSVAFGVLVGLIAAIGLAIAPPAARGAEPARLFRIGTGGEGGTYYPIGTLIAESLTGRDETCEGACGLDGLLAVAQLSNGSVSNVRGLAKGALEAALVQADVLHWAYTGSGIFEGDAPVGKLRAVANLYPESLHIVTLADRGIDSVRELAARRVSLDDPGSGTLVDARLVLDAYGLSEADLRPQYVKPQTAIELLRAERLDAFFIVAGYPVRAVQELNAGGDDVRLVPIGRTMARTVAVRYPFLVPSTIPREVYPGIEETPTLSVGAQLAVSAELPSDLIYAVTERLWSQTTLARLRTGHVKGRMVRRETALEGLSVPLHPGAERYYRDVGMLD